MLLFCLVTHALMQHAQQEMNWRFLYMKKDQTKSQYARRSWIRWASSKVWIHDTPKFGTVYVVSWPVLGLQRSNLKRNINFLKSVNFQNRKHYLTNFKKSWGGCHDALKIFDAQQFYTVYELCSKMTQNDQF